MERRVYIKYGGSLIKYFIIIMLRVVIRIIKFSREYHRAAPKSSGLVPKTNKLSS